MKIKRQLFQISILEICLYFILMFVSINVFFFIYTLIQGNIRFLLSDSSWIYQLVFPLMLAIVHNFVNRNGVLKITGISDIEELKSRLDLIIQRRGLVKTEQKSAISRYTKKTRLGRFFNLFIREDIKVNYLNEELLIYGKKHVFSPIESQLSEGKS